VDCAFAPSRRRRNVGQAARQAHGGRGTCYYTAFYPNIARYPSVTLHDDARKSVRYNLNNKTMTSLFASLALVIVIIEVLVLENLISVGLAKKSVKIK
jgi:hypothetical protein